VITYLPSHELVNESWFEKWGQSVGSPAIGTKLSGNARVRERLFKLLIEAFEIDVNASLPAGEIAALKLYSQDKARLSKVCGLVLHASFLGGKVLKQDFEVISGLFDVADLRIAMSLKELSFPGSKHQTDINRISDLVQHSGEACISSWKASLSPETAKRVRLLEAETAENFETNPTINPEHAVQVVEAVSALLDTPNPAFGKRG